MALIRCPECGQSISDRAANCPKCGCPIGQNTEAAAADDRQAKPPRTVKRKVLIPSIAVCAVLIAVGLFLAIRGSSGNLTVKDITISDWQLTDTSYFLDSYKGTVVSEQKKPFVAAIGPFHISVAFQSRPKMHLKNAPISEKSRAERICPALSM